MRVGRGESKGWGVVKLPNSANIIGKFDTNFSSIFCNMRYKPAPVCGGLAFGFMLLLCLMNQWLTSDLPSKRSHYAG
jgi:hypothetical protein